MRRTVLTFALFIGAALAPDAGAGPLDPYVYVGCWSNQNQCGDGHNSDMLKSPLRLAVSPDGKTVYSSMQGGGIAWSTRDAATGAITPAGCIATSGCTVTSTIAGEATQIIVSPDGQNVYQATDGRLEVFDRDVSTGALAYRECFNNGDAQCTSVAGIAAAYGVAISPDGANVYAASRSGGGYLQMFTRGAGGHLTDAGCFSASGTCGSNAAAPGIATARRVAVTPDGTGVYVVGAPSFDGTIAWFNRSGGALTYGGCMGPAPGTCPTDVTSYSEPLWIAISPDGHSVYVATAATFQAQLHHFERAGDNSLTSHECWTDPTRTSECGDGRQVPEIGAGQSLAVTNTKVYVAGHEQSAVTLFNRDGTTGGLTPVGCVKWISPVHVCGEANEYTGMDDIRSVVLSGDGTSLYTGAVYGIAAFQAPATQQPPDGGGPGGGGPGGGGPGGGPGATPVAPAIGAASLSSRILRNGRTLRLTITLDRAATIRAVIGKLVAGRKSKGRCVKPTKKLRRAKKCTRTVRKRTLTAPGKAGANTLTVKAKGLALGRYRIAITATADGLTSPARTVTFTRKR